MEKLSGVRKSYKRLSIEYNQEGVAFEGSEGEVLHAISDVMEAGLLSEVSLPGVKIGGMQLKKVKRAVKRGIDKAFSKYLVEAFPGLPQCLGDFSFRFITPTTKRSHFIETAKEIMSCSLCNHQDFCFKLSQIRKLEEHKWRED